MSPASVPNVAWKPADGRGADFNRYDFCNALKNCNPANINPDSFSNLNGDFYQNGHFYIYSDQYQYANKDDHPNDYTDANINQDADPADPALYDSAEHPGVLTKFCPPRSGV